ncbi:MAG: lysylphosphatidylglycerol synthase domain-containing protein, partial [Arenicellales bacterium]
MWQRPGTSLSQSLVRLIVGLTLSLLLFAALLHIVALSGSEVNLSMVFQTLKGMPLSVAVVYTLMLVANTLLRTVRYRLLLGASMGSGKISFPLLFIITGVRNMIVDLLPARLGELVFVTMLKKSCRVPVSAGIATLALSFLLDVVILIPLLLLVGMLPLTESTLRQGSLPAALLLGVIITIGIIVLWPGLRAFTRWSRGKTRTSGLAYRLVSFFSDVSDALTRCRQVGMLGWVLGLTAGIRILKYGGLILLFDTVVSSPGMIAAAANIVDVLV